MIEAVAVPILHKAVDFLFEQGKIILNESRKRRKKEQKPNESQRDQNIEGCIYSKDIALKEQVAETAVSISEAKITHLLALAETYSQNYYKAKEQYAKWGDALVPPIILHNLTEAEDNIGTTMQELRAVLSELYKKEVLVNGLQED